MGLAERLLFATLLSDTASGQTFLRSPAGLASPAVTAANVQAYALEGQQWLDDIGRMDKKTMPMDESEWRKRLSPEQYRVLREKGTEPPFTGEYLEVDSDGTFTCAACGNALFSSDAKFDSGTGWPSFDEALPGAVEYHTDTTHGMVRTEITCARCGSHLGHVFDDGPTESGKRYCINSVCLNLDETDAAGKK
ncbi:methionine-R-sulfoxide reductase [Hyphomicrobium facile]|uniref:peptide-methionine (R)-S-oxide reductase n=2 Tax=Hyphomicrobium facile TaxID=51670 RepID=A0A1I7N286_9HYPH|nr:methionine-R-sulfoxide reductase [Hyphomicrobium facile]